MKDDGVATRPAGYRADRPAASMAPLWWLTKDGDKSCLALYERHYSCNHYADGRKRVQFVGPGENIVLRTLDADALFVWRNYIDDTIPEQDGIECAVFRNEGSTLSSELIRQSDAVADHVWPHQRHYTKVNASAVRSTNAGFCFIAAGWKRCGKTKGGLLILERKAVPPPEIGAVASDGERVATTKTGGG